MSKLERPGRDDQRKLEALASDVRALNVLLADTARQLAALGGAEEALPVDEWLAKATPDELLDRWQEVRGEKAEAYLFGRIKRRRAVRRVATAG